MALTQEEKIELTVDAVITKYKTTGIIYYPYVSGATDLYGQRTRTYGTPVTLTGRAILNPTPEQVTVIGNGEVYDIAFLFSRIQMRLKFPTEDEGEWLDIRGEMKWWGTRRYKIEKVAPTGQVGENFLIIVVLGTTILGARD
jgi:hypothetical protein